MYLGSTTHTKYLELSILTMVSLYMVQDDEGYLKNLTKKNYILQYQYFIKFFTRSNQGGRMFAKGKTLIIISFSLDSWKIWVCSVREPEMGGGMKVMASYGFRCGGVGWPARLVLQPSH